MLYPLSYGGLGPAILQEADCSLTYADSRTSARLAAYAPSMAPAYDFAGRRPRGLVLVCDDVESIRRLVAMNLELGGFQVLEAGDGEVALSLLRQRAATGTLPDVVILDVQMSPCDGWSVLAQIRGDQALVHLPVVMTSAGDEQEWHAGPGLDSWLRKPFDPQLLIDLVTGFARHGRRFRPPRWGSGTRP